MGGGDAAVAVVVHPVAADLADCPSCKVPAFDPNSVAVDLDPLNPHTRAVGINPSEPVVGRHAAVHLRLRALQLQAVPAIIVYGSVRQYRTAVASPQRYGRKRMPVELAGVKPEPITVAVVPRKDAYV